MARAKNEGRGNGSGAAKADPEPDDVKYGAAVTEIEQILASIDRDEVDLDELGQKVERAVELLKICRAKLKATEARVTDVLKDLAAEEAASDAEEADASSDENDDGRSSPDSPRKSRSAKPDADDDEELPF